MMRNFFAITLAFLLSGLILGRAPAAVVSQLGADQNVLVICVKYSDVATTRLANCDDWATLLENEVDTFFNQATFGQTTFNFQVGRTAWYDLGMATADYNFFVVGQRAIELADADADFSNFHRVVVITNFTGFGGQGGGPWRWTVNEGGEATFMEDGALVDKRLMTLSITNEWTDSIPGVTADDAATVVAHELGHQLGAPTHYASVRWFPGIGRDVMTPWGIMGLSPTLNHFVGWAKEHRQWINPASVVTVGPPAGSDIDQTIRLRPLENSTGQPQFIRVPLTMAPSFFGYVIENRRQINGDGELPQPGVLISLLDENPGRILKYIVLTDPDAPANMREAPLEVGNVFADPSSGLTITYVRDTGNHANVRIQYATLGANRPNPSITPWGAPPWETPDIWIDSEKNGWGTYLYTDGSGNPTGNGDKAWVDHVNRVYVKITNTGMLPATNVRAQVYVNSPPGMGDRGADWDYLGTIVIPSLGAGTSATEFVKWRPRVGEHTCIKVVILDLPNEISTADNLAQENVAAFETSDGSPYKPVMARFEVNNPFDDAPTQVIFHVRDIPRGWTMMVEPRSMVLDPGISDSVFVALFPSGLQPSAEQQKYLKEVNRPGFIGMPKIEAQVAYADTFIPIGGIEIWTHLVEKTSVICRVGDLAKPPWKRPPSKPDDGKTAPPERLRPKGSAPEPKLNGKAKLRKIPDYGRAAAPSAVRDALAAMNSSTLIRAEPAAVVARIGDVIKVTGWLSKAAAGKIILVEMTGTNKRRSIFAKTSSDGSFVTSFKSLGKGSWKVHAYFDGDRILGSSDHGCGRVVVK